MWILTIRHNGKKGYVNKFNSYKKAVEVIETWRDGLEGVWFFLKWERG